MKTAVAIAAAGTISSAGVLPAGHDFYGFLMPAGWDAANVTFQASVDGGTTFNVVTDDGGTPFIATAPAVDEIILFTGSIGHALRHLTHIKLVASAAQNGGARTLQLLSREAR